MPFSFAGFVSEGRKLRVSFPEMEPFSAASDPGNGPSYRKCNDRSNESQDGRNYGREFHRGTSYISPKQRRHPTIKRNEVQTRRERLIQGAPSRAASFDLKALWNIQKQRWKETCLPTRRLGRLPKDSLNCRKKRVPHPKSRRKTLRQN